MKLMQENERISRKHLEKIETQTNDMEKTKTEIYKINHTMNWMKLYQDQDE